MTQLLKSVEDCPYCYGSGDNTDPDKDTVPKCRACDGRGKTSPELLAKAIEVWDQMQNNTQLLATAPSLIGKTYEEFKVHDPIGANEFEGNLLRMKL